MICRTPRFSLPRPWYLLVGLLGSLVLAPTACGSSSSDNPDGGGPNGDDTGDDDTSHPPPPVKCGGGSDDADAKDLDFANNLIASPAPPGNLDAANAPQIVVFGFDDVES